LNLYIGFNDALTDLSGLENITTVGLNLKLFYNDVLTNLDGLSGITTLGGEISLFSNETLTDVSGLENIAANTITFLEIVFNDQLSDCAVQSICDYLAVATNDASFLSNAPGCQIRAQVETACIVPTTEISATDIELFPNPTTGQLQLRNINAERVEVFNAQGQQVASYRAPGQELDLSALPTGMYYLQLIAADGAYGARVVKQ